MKSENLMKSVYIKNRNNQPLLGTKRHGKCNVSYQKRKKHCYFFGKTLIKATINFTTIN